MPRRSFWLVLGSAGVLALPAAVQAQQSGVVTGVVTDAASGQPVPAAQLSVVGTTIGAITNEAGRYTIRGVPARQLTVRVLRVGYAEQSKPATVTASGSVTVDFALRQASVALTPVVTTATGQTRRVEVGNAISQIDAVKRVEEAPIRNVTDMLTAQAAGVNVTPNNFAGAGARVRIRGTSSLSLSNDPIYVIDGVRMTSNIGSSSIGVGGTLPSRVGDLNPDEIENIEVVKGPSAATLYGTDAANGVIVITTKKGRAGRARLQTYVEQGLSQDKNPYPANYNLFGKGTGATSTGRCVLNAVAAGTCTVDSVTSFNPLRNSATTPFTDGYRQQYGLNLSGGSEVARYFTSAEYESEQGPYTFPDFEIARFAANNATIRGNQLNPSRNVRQSYRANLTTSPTSKLDLGLNTNFIQVAYRAPQTDNNITGLYYNALGPGIRDTALRGYVSYTPGDIFQNTTTQDVNRFIGSTNLNWRPMSWLANRANLGIDYTSRLDQGLCRRGECANFGTNRTQGFANDNRAGLRNVTADLGSTASWQPFEQLGTKTTIGAQYVNYRLDENRASGANLPPGSQTAGAGTVPGVTTNTVLSKTLGYYVQEELAWRDRVFITGAVRTDQNSAFGTDFQRVYYPKASLSYVISEEDWFPKPDFVDQVRLRSTYGAAGTQPGPNDALRFFASGAVNIAGADQPAIAFSTLGNANLKPERASEFESGMDVQLFGNRVNLDLTYYSKNSKDALISRIIPPTVGTNATTRFENLGAVKNAGFEALVNLTVIDRPAFGWDATINGSTNANKLVDLGGVPPQIGTTTQQRAGYPLNGYWGRELKSFNDADGNGIIQASEIVVGDTAEFLGYSLPRHNVSFTNGFSFFNRKLRVQGLVDYQGGHMRYNNTERFRCQSAGSTCRALLDRSTPLSEQAKAIAVTQHPSRTLAAYIEKADFVRLREVSATFAPTSFFGRSFSGIRNTSLTLSARNLAVWTDYTGIDPETDYGADLNTPQDFFTSPPLRYFTLRVNVGF
jgi:TonB-linked SusC/RagA family outer membrane protein